MSEPLDEAAQQRALWRRWQATEGAATASPMTDTVTLDELTLAAHAEGRLSPDLARTIDAVLDDAPDLAADVAIARLGAADLGGGDAAAETLASVIARASALVPASGDRVIAFRAAAPRPEPSWRMAVRWGALAASLAMVSYLGFALGSNATMVLAALNQQAGVSDELLDPPTGFLSGLSEASGT